LHNWRSFKTQSEPRLREVIVEKQRELHTERSNMHIQTYATHPFIDIYATMCDKGIAYDRIISEIPITDSAIQKVMYLGDSGNDNLVFRKAGISIGINLDGRLSPKLD
jgi:hydroxymethylpyrimidine pyrophosphatase-like HAD family hydrolase